MIVKTGLLIVSNPKQIGTVLSSIKNHVNKTLYIQLLSALSEPIGSFYPNVFNSSPKYSRTITRIYSQVACHCEDLDVRVLLSGLKYSNLKQIRTQRAVDLVIFDRNHAHDDIASFIDGKIANAASGCGFVTFDCGAMEEPTGDDVADNKVYKHTVLGGTFDRLHVAHKILLTETALRSNSKVTIGVTTENMLESKTLWELVEPVEQRMATVRDFLTDIVPELEINVVPISDPFGPTKDDPSMEMLVVSAETLRGGNKINEIRAEKGFAPLDIVSIDLIDEPHRCANEESKISSSTARMRVLGTLIKPVRVNEEIPKKPYVIGLTGGIGSGKSGVGKVLGELGAYVVDCDKLAHELYKPGGPCYKLVVDAFGEGVVSESGEINRKALGTIVFQDPKELEKLNSLVWPAIADEVRNRIAKSDAKIVVVEAAILLPAGWSKICHEIWTTIVPRSEAIERLKARNGLTEEQASARIASQPANKSYVEAANVVICSLWPVEYTRQQIETAWNLLQERMPC